MIEVINVSKSYGDLKAVDNLSLTIPEGELFCFLGPNGAGKTTTIKMMCGLLKPDAGEIRLAGLSMQEDPLPIKKITGYIPDTPFVYERLTCTEFVLFVGDLYRVPREKIEAQLDDTLKLFGLTDHRRSLVKDLSHGLRQRLVYAATMLHEPKILLVDEPFIGLDPYSIRLIKDLMREKARSGTTILLTTHILALAEDMADRIGIMYRGTLAALGTLDQLMEEHRIDGRLEDVFLKLTRREGDAD